MLELPMRFLRSLTTRLARRTSQEGTKEREWTGYYRYYLSTAKDRGVNALEVLDEQWADGETNAERAVLPHVTASSCVLEIACGIGRVSRFVAPHCSSLCCTDILDEALTEARRNLARFANVSFKKTNGYDLSEFPDEEFDCVYSFTAFFHLDWDLVVTYFAEITRVLRPGGVGILEFKACRTQAHLAELLEKIRTTGGIDKYEVQRDKWRYVSCEMLECVCEANRLEIIDRHLPNFTFRRRRV